MSAVAADFDYSMQLQRSRHLVTSRSRQPRGPLSSFEKVPALLLMLLYKQRAERIANGLPVAGPERARNDGTATLGRFRGNAIA